MLNMWQLLRTVPDEFRGRVFATNESMQWSVMMLSMCAAGIASRVLESADHRRGCGRVEFDDGGFLGLGECDGAVAGAGAAWNRAGGDRGTWRTGSVVSSCRAVTA